MAKILSSFFEVSCREVKLVLRVAFLHLTWVNFILVWFGIASALELRRDSCGDRGKFFEYSEKI